MITLAAGGTLNGKAGTASSITYTIYGDTLTTTDAFGILGQGTLGTSAAAMLTTSPVPSSTTYLIKEIQFANTSASQVLGITLYVDGTGTGNQINGGWTIAASGSATLDSTGTFHSYDANGLLLTTQLIQLTGDATGLGAGTIATTVGKINGTSMAGLATGILKNTTGTGVPSIAVSGTDYAAPGNYITALTGDVAASGPGSASSTVSKINNTSLAGLATGLLKNTTGTGVPSIAVAGTDYQAAGAVTNVTGTTPISASGGTTPAISISAATTSAAGSMSAADKTTVSNMWYDVTNYGVTTSNSGATNTTNMNTLIQTTAPAGAKFFFPQTGANYPFSGSITVTKNDQTFFGTGQYGSVLFQDSTTASLFVVNDGIQNVTFRDMGMWSTVTMTAGSAIQCGAATAGGAGVSQLLVNNVGFQGYGGTWFNCIALYGSNSGIVSTIDNCQINNFTNWGIGMVGNTSTPVSEASLVIDNCTLNGGGVAVAGVYCQQAGALEMVDCDVISCVNNLLISPLSSTSQIVTSFYATSCYFDHASGSSVKFAGAGAIARCRFINCYMTINSGSTGYSACEIAGTGYTTGVVFENCSFLNTFLNSGTSNGLLITNAYDVVVLGCTISGFTNGIQVTPTTTAGQTRLQIVDNTIGPAGGITGNTTGILLNAGSAAYGQIQIANNVFPPTQGSFTANTTNITDNSTVTAPNEKNIQSNLGTGLDVYSFRTTASQTISAVNTTMADVTGLNFPINVPNTKYQFDAMLNVSASTSSSTAVGIALNAPAGATVAWNVLGATNTTTMKAPFFSTAINVAPTTSAGSGFITATGFTGLIQVTGVVLAGSATSHTGLVQVRLNTVSTASTLAQTATVQAYAAIVANKITN